MSVTIENKEYYTLEKLRSGGFKPLPTTRDGILKEIPEQYRIFYQNGEKNGLKKVNGGGSIGVLADYANSVWRAPVTSVNQQVVQKYIPAKKKVAVKRYGIPLPDCLRVISKQSNYSCLYFLCLEVGKDFIIGKYGRTKRLEARLHKHKISFGEEISLIFTVAIDSHELAKAESELKKIIKPTEFVQKFKGKNCEEIFKIPMARIKDIKKSMRDLKVKYSFELKERGVKISEQAIEIANLKSQIEIMNQSVSNEIVLRDKEIANLKIQLSCAKIDLENEKNRRAKNIRTLKNRHEEALENMRLRHQNEIYAIRLEKK